MVEEQYSVRDIVAIEGSPYFDEPWYVRLPHVFLDGMSPAEHYLKTGWRAGLNPGPGFDGKDYLARNPDVASAGICPLLHFERRAREDGRRGGVVIPHCAVKVRCRRPGERKVGVVYTCITGGYDTLPLHAYRDERWDYVCFTDSQTLLEEGSINGWQIRPLAYSASDNARNARWHKMHPHVLFPDCGVSLWLDGNILPLNAFAFDRADDLIAGGISLSAPPHPWRSDIYEEAEEVIRARRDWPEIVRTQISLYKQDGFPRGTGLNETGLIFRQHHDVLVVKLMEEWFSWVLHYSRRDQLSFNYLLWKHSYETLPFCERKDWRGASSRNFVVVYQGAHDCRSIEDEQSGGGLAKETQNEE